MRLDSLGISLNVKGHKRADVYSWNYQRCPRPNVSHTGKAHIVFDSKHLREYKWVWTWGDSTHVRGVGGAGDDRGSCNVSVKVVFWWKFLGGRIDPNRGADNWHAHWPRRGIYGVRTQYVMSIERTSLVEYRTQRAFQYNIKLVDLIYTYIGLNLFLNQSQVWMP